MLLDPIGAVNAVAQSLNSFYSALAAGTATGQPTLNVQLQTLVYELSILPTSTLARRALRALAAAAASSGVTISVLAVSPLMSIPGTPSSPPASASSGLSAGAIAGIAIGSLILAALIVFAAAVVIDRRRRRRRSKLVAFRVESARRLKASHASGRFTIQSPLRVIAKSSNPKPASLNRQRPVDSALAAAVVDDVLQRSASIRRLRNSVIDMHHAAHDDAEHVVSPEQAQRSHALTRALTAQQLMPDDLAPTTAQRRVNPIAAAAAAAAPLASNPALVAGKSHARLQARTAGGPTSATVVGNNPLHSSRAVLPHAGAAGGLNNQRATTVSNPLSSELRRANSMAVARKPLPAEARRAAVQSAASPLQRPQSSLVLSTPKSGQPRES